MPLINRPYSINSFCLAKVWFRCNSINLRCCDIAKISACVKSWLFADQLEKPEESILFRTRKLGGLGLTNVLCKSKALLIKSFLETSVMSNFTHNLYHEALYRWYVEGCRDFSQPILPPYYDQSFFEIIREVKLEGLLNVSKMSTRQWYRFLLEKLVTHQTVNSVSVLRQMKVEINLPNVNWERSWAMLNCGGLPSLETSFLWRMINNLLPVPSRLYRMKMANATTDLCTLCNEGRVGDLNHCLLKCSFNREASLFLVKEV